MVHGSDGVGMGTWSKICLEEVMVEQTIPGTRQEKEAKGPPGSRDRVRHTWKCETARARREG